MTATLDRPAPRVRPPGVVRLGPLSAVVRWRAVLVPLVTLALLVLLSALSLGRGDYPIPVTDVLRALVGLGEQGQRFVVVELRAPRIVVGLLVGMALGMAGALFQTFSRNALASPDVLGITEGASLGAVAAIVIGGGASTAGSVLGAVGIPLAALVGAFVAGTLLFLLAWRAGINGYRLVLVGIALWAGFQALIDWLLTEAQIWDAAAAYVWLTGSLNARTWEQAGALSVSLAVLVPLALLTSRALGVLQFGDDTARGLGVRVTGAQAAVVLVAIALTAAAVAAAGPIAFVALVVPQIAVRLTGGPRPPLLAAGLLGATLVVGADLVARTVLPTALPVGILTAAIGAPYLLWLLVRGRRRTTL
ncbi:FecCD family ABC transporter permease [Blastococcus sp. SYSU D00669]